MSRPFTLTKWTKLWEWPFNFLHKIFWKHIALVSLIDLDSDFFLLIVFIWKINLHPYIIAVNHLFRHPCYHLYKYRLKFLSQFPNLLPFFHLVVKLCLHCIIWSAVSKLKLFITRRQQAQKTCAKAVSTRQARVCHWPWSWASIGAWASRQLQANPAGKITWTQIIRQLREALISKTNGWWGLFRNGMMKCSQLFIIIFTRNVVTA